MGIVRFFCYLGGLNLMNERRKVELLDTCDYYFEERKKDGIEEGIGLVLDFCGFEHCLPRHSFGPHVRNNYVIHVVIDGEGVLEFDGQKRRIGKDQSFILFPGETTTYWADRTNPWYYCWIGFHGDMADKIVESMGFTRDNPIVDVHNSKEAEDIIRQMLGTKELELDGQLRRYACMMTLFSELIEVVSRENRDEPPLQIISYAEYAERFINNHYREKIRIQDLAQHIGISRSYLVKLMKQETGMSPQEYLIATRMKRASEFLIRTNDSIRNVADECGYDDALAFSKVFKAKFGINPSDYRLKYRESSGSYDEGIEDGTL